MDKTSAMGEPIASRIPRDRRSQIIADQTSRLTSRHHTGSIPAVPITETAYNSPPHGHRRNDLDPQSARPASPRAPAESSAALPGSPIDQDIGTAVGPTRSRSRHRHQPSHPRVAAGAAVGGTTKTERTNRASAVVDGDRRARLVHHDEHAITRAHRVGVLRVVAAKAVHNTG